MTTPPWVPDEPTWQRFCQRACKACDSLLAGTIGLIEASRELAALSQKLLADSDPDFLTFVAIDSETDHLPIGRFREGWNAESLAQKDIEIGEHEAFHRAAARKSAQNLLRKLRDAQWPRDNQGFV